MPRHDSRDMISARRFRVWCAWQPPMGTPISNLTAFTLLTPRGTVCPASMKYASSMYEYYPTQYAQITTERCASRCLLEPACTGFMTTQQGVNAEVVNCQLWKDGACGGPGAPGAYQIDDTLQPVLTYVLCSPPSGNETMNAGSGEVDMTVDCSAWAPPSPPPFPPYPPSPPNPPPPPPSPPAPPVSPPYPPFGSIVTARNADELLQAVESPIVETIQLEARRYTLPRQILVRGRNATSPLTIRAVGGYATLDATYAQYGALGDGLRNPEARVLQAHDSTIRLESLILTGGWWAATQFGGGGLSVWGADAHATLVDTHVVGNAAAQSGGGIDVYLGTLEMHDSTVTNNTGMGGTGINLYFSPSVNLTGCNVTDNIASLYFGGGILNWNTTLTLTQTSIMRNQAPSTIGSGAGIYNFGGQLVMNSCTLSDNAAGFQGGGLSSFFRVMNNGDVLISSVNLTDTAVSGNTAPTAAAIYNHGGVIPYLCNQSVSCAYGAKLEIYGNGSVIRANHATDADGVAVKNFGTAYIGKGASIGNNTGGQAQAVNNANMTFVLPAPPGMYLSNAFTCEVRNCTDLITNRPFRCPQQNCDVETRIGEELAKIKEGMHSESIPTFCGSSSFFCTGQARKPVKPGYMSVGSDGTIGSCTNDCVAELICPPGYWCSAGIAIACPNGTYTDADMLPRTTAQACISCPGFVDGLSTSPLASSSATQCEALAGFYRVDEPGQEVTFHPCFAGANCSGGGSTLETIDLKRDYWRPWSISTMAKLCPADGVCLGGQPRNVTVDNATAMLLIDSCAPGLIGPFCMDCVAPGSFFDSTWHRCEQCGTSILLSLMIIVAIVLALVLLYCIIGRNSRDGFATIERLRTRASITWHRLGLKMKLRIVISFYQILTQLSFVTGFVEPLELRNFTATFHWLMKLFNITNLFGWLAGFDLVCFGITALEWKLAVSLVPAVICVSLVLNSALSRAQYGYSVNLTVWIGYLIAPALSSRGFRALAECECFTSTGVAPPACFLRLDYTVSCTPTWDGAEWGPAFAPANVRAMGWVNVAVYGFAPFAVVGWVLFREKAAITRVGPPTRLSHDISLLYDGYRPGVYAWELVDMLRKLLLTGVLSLVLPGTISQLFLGLVLSLSLLAIFVWCAPYEDTFDNFLSVLSSAALTFFLLAELGIAELGICAELGTALPSCESGNSNQQVGITIGAIVSLSLSVLVATGANVAYRARHLDSLPLLRWEDTNRITTAPAIPTGKSSHFFVSHVWKSGQDQARAIKQLLKELVGGLKIWLDVDDLHNIADLETEVDSSVAVIIFLSGSMQADAHAQKYVSDYFRSPNCLREFKAATERPDALVIIVLETDPLHGGIPLEVHRNACPADMRAAFDAMPMVHWYRQHDFQIVSLKMIVEPLLNFREKETRQTRRSTVAYKSAKSAKKSRFGSIVGAPSALVGSIVGGPNAGAPRAVPVDRKTTVRGELLKQRLAFDGAGAHIYASAHNGPLYSGAIQSRATLLVRQLIDECASVGMPAGTMTLESQIGSANRFLLLLTEFTFVESLELQDLVFSALQADKDTMRLVTCYESSVPFDAIISSTPDKLRNAGLFTQLAVPLHPGAHAEVSRRMLLKALGAEAPDSRSMSAMIAGMCLSCCHPTSISRPYGKSFVEEEDQYALEMHPLPSSRRPSDRPTDRPSISPTDRSSVEGRPSQV